jgi:hypothetical protein
MTEQELSTKFFGREEIETRRHVKGNKVMVGKFYSDGTMIASFVQDNRFMDSPVTLKEYCGSDEVEAARRLLEEKIDLSYDFSAMFA